MTDLIDGRPGSWREMIANVNDDRRVRQRRPVADRPSARFKGQGPERAEHQQERDGDPDGRHASSPLERAEHSGGFGRSGQPGVGLVWSRLPSGDDHLDRTDRAPAQSAPTQRLGGLPRVAPAGDFRDLVRVDPVQTRRGEDDLISRPEVLLANKGIRCSGAGVRPDGGGRACQDRPALGRIADKQPARRANAGDVKA